MSLLRAMAGDPAEYVDGSVWKEKGTVQPGELACENAVSPEALLAVGRWKHASRRWPMGCPAPAQRLQQTGAMAVHPARVDLRAFQFRRLG
jgi:hypothetical protein